MKDGLEAFRRRTGEEFCARLRAMGIDAQLLLEKDDREPWIRITGGPIRLIKIRKKAGCDYGYCTDYVVPDWRRSEKVYRFTISTVRVRTFPIFGRVVDLRWKGSDCGTGIIDQLQGDMLIRQAIMKSGDIRIHASYRHAAYREWTIRPMRDSVIPPSKEEWNCYQAIARQLLDMKV